MVHRLSSLSDVETLKRHLLQAKTLIEDARSIAKADPDLAERLQAISSDITNEMSYLEMVAPKIVRPAAWQTR